MRRTYLIVILGCFVVGMIGVVNLGQLMMSERKDSKSDFEGQLDNLETGGFDNAEPSEAAESEDIKEIGERLVEADAQKGQRIYKKCAACHNPDFVTSGVGPPLLEIVGRPIGSWPNYSYSNALSNITDRWSYQALDEYLEDPKAWASGTSMNFRGLRKPQDRADLIAYLDAAARSADSIPVDLSIVLGLPSNSDTETTAVARLEDQLNAADLAFNRPDTMRIGTTTTVELVLSPKTAPRAAVSAEASVTEQAESLGLTADLEGTTQFVEDINYAVTMEATLAGLDFTVEPPGAQRQTVLPGQSAKWVWSVQPKAHGPDRVLRLDLDAVIQKDGNDLAPVRIRTFTERIVVDISAWDRLVVSAKSISAVNAAVAGVGGTVIAVLGWALSRTRKKKANEEDADEKDET